ncbi:nucleotidyltransferase domain-containing protein [Halobellus limi]|jgi:predicted nucleotidyltransferase|uniref:Nucleotidyltransferase domain-containing protein n=2 Tax=Halobellus limi TaxID=699433 RepID=A0A1H6CJK9_9EURY|nr:nucleotidyltransferase domain-containing protein [Halobellus limi]SEG73112.1 Nucleotidyltransferase domain-containing protein [Halobellus limi]
MPNRKESISIALQYPFPEDRVFRYQAMQDVLDVLIDQPYATYSMSELATLTGANKGTISKAVRLLSELDAVETAQEGRARQVRINRERLTKPDPVLSIPQVEFHQPVQAFLQRLQDELDELVGVVLFGSVARGEADRTSDIDLLVIVDGNKTAARRTVQSVVSDLEDQRFEGDRYTFQPIVESTDSVQRIGDRLRPQFDDGITLVGSDRLSGLRTEVYTDE